MGDIELKTENNRCHTCGWWATYYYVNFTTRKRTPVYYCQVKDFYSKHDPKQIPTPAEGKCLCFRERYNEKEDEEED